MRQTIRFPMLLLAMLAWVGLAGCSFIKTAATASPTLNVTQALQTVAARLTQVAALTPTRPVPTLTPSPVDPTPSLSQETVTPSPGGPTSTAATAVEAGCDKAAPGIPKIDVTVDDNTTMEPGEAFTKVWRLVNSGTCTWNRQYHAVWFFGEKLGDELSVPLNGEVPPNESVDISVEMVAPLQPGTYQGNWKLSNSSGVLFGIGPDGDLPFWVKIIVTEKSTPTAKPATPTTIPITPTISPTVVITPTTAPAILISGTATLAPGSMLDLDANLIIGGPGADLLYHADANNTHWLSAQGIAALGVYGGSEPTLRICQAATMSSAPIALESLSPGTYLCYQTDNHHLGWLRYDSIDGISYNLQVSLFTWASPF